MAEFVQLKESKPYGVTPVSEKEAKAAINTYTKAMRKGGKAAEKLNFKRKKQSKPVI